MADNDRGQSLISKYVWVIETIHRRRKISFKELNRRWLDDDISRGVKIPKRTFDNWRYVIWDMFGINIVNENRGEYRYYIENEEDISKNGLRSWLYNAFCVSNALANSQSVKDRILLEFVPSGQQYLQPIIEAMKENRVIKITAQVQQRKPVCRQFADILLGHVHVVRTRNHIVALAVLINTLVLIRILPRNIDQKSIFKHFIPPLNDY